MSEYKLLSFEPTPEMVSAAEDAYMPFGDMDLALRMAILAAPAVQGEPVAYQIREKGSDNWYAISASHYQYITSRKHDWGHAEVRELYTAPQPAEQKTAPDVAVLAGALDQCVTSMIDSGYRADSVVIRAARYALAAHRKQGGE